jgi:hypothetical protein
VLHSSARQQVAARFAQLLIDFVLEPDQNDMDVLALPQKV